MGRRDVERAVDAVFVQCIVSVDSMRAFGRAISLVRRLSVVPGRAHFALLASALEEQQQALQALRKNAPQIATRHVYRRDRALQAFFQAERIEAARQR